MQIKIDKNGEVKVTFTQTERTALATTINLCQQISKWLNDPDATDAVQNLGNVVATYIPQKGDVPEQESGEVLDGN